MKLLSFVGAQSEPRIGVVLADLGAESIVDVAGAHRQLSETSETSVGVEAALRGGDMKALLETGEAGMEALRALLARVSRLISAPEERANWSRSRLLLDPQGIQFLPPVPRPGKIISVGANYPKHLTELDDSSFSSIIPGLKDKDFPIAFAKMPSTLTAHGAPIVYPKWTTELDYEGEFCLVIGKRCKNVPAEDALSVIAGYTIINDVSMRDIQVAEMKRGMLLMGKNLDTTMPAGPYLVTPDEIADPMNVRLRTLVNGEERQSASTSEMIIDIPSIIAYWSRMTLEPGDMITTGSPAGVAIGSADPARNLLKPGDVVEVEIEGLGRLRNRVEADQGI
ncbi:fumarylacetoacetate hydrolase family protein [Sphingobium sp.]|uniref:fumarylacetoacetate hydrolase family protein n=1 Tax=Sphingobium sp. TaxID=1912891 RepID=UPI0028BEFBD5|nr:fumarylacetoacetate hydrolase family protein [Sphingobium sp.]